jgi:hypothetical protein
MIDPLTGALSNPTSGTLANPRTGHMAVATGDRLFLMGGSPSYDNGFIPLATIDQYAVDESTCMLTFLGSSYSLPEPRWSSASVAIPNSSGVRAYVIAGQSTNNVLITSVAGGQLP